MIGQWRAQFAENPQQAVSDLFSGRARLGASMRLDVPEILYYEFPEEQTERRVQLDTALLGWLTDMRNHCQPQMQRLGFAVYARRLCDGLQSIHLLDLPRSTAKLRELQDSWLAFLRPLRVAPERDPALELLRVLTRHQPQHVSPALWQQLAGEPRAEYLQVALLGLQRLPLTNAADNQRLMLHALLLHAIQQDGSPAHAASAYRQQFKALQQRYPRGPQHWLQLEQQALAAVGNHPLPGKDAFLQELAQRSATGNKPAQAFKKLDCPSLQETQQLRQLILDTRQPTASVFAQLQNMLGRLQRYAEQTGDGYFFVRTLCNHGKLLLTKREDLQATALDWLEQQIEQALHWEPSHEYTWTFWSDLLARRGRHLQQEWVLREAVRLFPEREACRVELARRLMQQGEQHWPEAEHWLREVVERHPADEPSRVELARLLMQQGEQHWPEAEHWLREVVERHPANEPSRVELARLLSWCGDFAGAEQQLAACLQQHPHDQIARNALHHIQSGQALSRDIGPKRAPAPRKPQAGQGIAADSPRLQELAERSGLQACWWLARQQAGEARAQLRQQAAGGNWLAATYCQWLPDAETDEQAVPPHAWGWRAALTWLQGDEQHWQALQADFPERQGETGLLRWLRRNEATPELERFLNSGRNPEMARLQAAMAELPLAAPQRSELARDLTLALT